MPVFDDLSGGVFERLTVQRRADNDHVKPSGVRVVMYDCLCACGNKVTVAGHRLREKRTRSCGCLRRTNKSAMRAGNR
jgi:hypothetical protein